MKEYLYSVKTSLRTVTITNMIRIKDSGKALKKYKKVKQNNFSTCKLIECITRNEIGRCDKNVEAIFCVPNVYDKYLMFLSMLIPLYVEIIY